MSFGKTVAAGIAAAVLMGSALILTTSARAQLGAPPPPSGGDIAVTKGVYGDWKLQCENQPGAQNMQCIIAQKVVDESSPDIVLSVIVFRTADGKNTLMRVVAPLGVLLPRGLGLKIDETDFGRVGFVRCLTTGCVSEVEMKDDLLTKFRSGQSATFLVFKTLEQGIGIPITLGGFGEAYDNLPKVVP